MSESKPSDDASLFPKALSKLGQAIRLRTNRDDTCLRARRRHDLGAGFGTERENLAPDVKGNDKWQTP
ncbi:hypothetical protein [Paraburkholderia heleia]|uniref:hypothetical protein n=1 Tax=Paraburkholderia heleia TaxID=634127 RepID=UPI002AB7A704|nr:hypothetical protein [Paraburkholderia heleia]